jgi:glycerol-3-phosphate dehydrogenase
MEVFDLVVIGGGIHGCGVAVDAAGRGLTVALFEKDDLGSGTSSCSTKLIHGGLRYLESFEFSLVRQCLLEQRLLLKNAGYLVEPLPFVIPVDHQSRPMWMIRLGLFFYDRLTARPMPDSSTLSQEELSQLSLKNKPKAAFRYYDCQTDDNRLVIADALLAHQLGAKIFTRHPVTSIVSTKEAWIIRAEGPHGPVIVKAKAIANMTGPWLNTVIQQCNLPSTKVLPKLVQGSHLIVKKLYEGKEALAHQHHDGRLIFFIPYLDHFTLVGTTDYALSEMPVKPKTSEEELVYLKNIIFNVFGRELKDDELINHYAGVRSLMGSHYSASKASRDYKIEKLYCPLYQHPIVHLLGGKITTWRLVSEDIVSTIKKEFPSMKSPWTHTKILPGARLDTPSSTIFHELKVAYPLIRPDLLERWAKTYGLRTYELIGSRSSLNEFGAHIGHILYEREVEFLLTTEWASTIDDILYRRTKIGLLMNRKELELAYAWFGQASTSVKSS